MGFVPGSWEGKEYNTRVEMGGNTTLNLARLGENSLITGWAFSALGESGMTSETHPIGIFDSGVGGLSVLQAVRDLLPEENLIYIADQVHVPYGDRSREEVRGFAEGIVRYLLARGSKLIVVACNTASAAALNYLRSTFPEVPFVGMEPAVKPAAESTSSGVVGVLATPATFQGELYESTVDRFARGVTILQDTCPGLVTKIEMGQVTGQDTREILEGALQPMVAKGVDKVVMGCTHYPFVIPLIEEIVGPEIEVIDPAPAVARQAKRLLDKHRLHTDREVEGRILFMTTGDPAQFAALLPQLIGMEGDVVPLQWRRGSLSSQS